MIFWNEISSWGTEISTFHTKSSAFFKTKRTITCRQAESFEDFLLKTGKLTANNKNPSYTKNYRERVRAREGKKLGSNKPSFWSFSLNSFSKALSIMSAKLPSLGLETDTLDSVALVWTSRSDSPSGWAWARASASDGTKSAQRRSRVGAKVKTSLLLTEDEDLPTIAGRGMDGADHATPAQIERPSLRLPRCETTGALAVEVPKL